MIEKNNCVTIHIIVRFENIKHGLGQQNIIHLLETHYEFHTNPHTYPLLIPTRYTSF